MPQFSFCKLLCSRVPNSTRTSRRQKYSTSARLDPQEWSCPEQLRKLNWLFTASSPQSLRLFFRRIAVILQSSFSSKLRWNWARFVRKETSCWFTSCALRFQTDDGILVESCLFWRVWILQNASYIATTCLLSVFIRKSIAAIQKQKYRFQPVFFGQISKQCKKRSESSNYGVLFNLDKGWNQFFLFSFPFPALVCGCLAGESSKEKYKSLAESIALL